MILLFDAFVVDDEVCLYVDGRDALVAAIWRDDRNGSTSYELIAGQKRYFHVWDSDRDRGVVTGTWGWVVNEAAVCTWAREGRALKYVNVAGRVVGEQFDV